MTSDDFQLAVQRLIEQSAPWEVLPPGSGAKLRELEIQRKCPSVSDRLCRVVSALQDLVSSLRQGMGDWCPACFADVSESEGDHMMECSLLAAETVLDEDGREGVE